MLTLSDDLRIYYDLGNSYIGQNVTYNVYLSANMQSKLIYTGQIYYMKPSYLYFKDIVTPYVVDNHWFKEPLDAQTLYAGVNSFTVTVTFSTGYVVTSDVITPTTTIPTIELTDVPSIYPIFKDTSEFFFGFTVNGSTEIYISTSIDTPSYSDSYVYKFDGNGHVCQTAAQLSVTRLDPIDATQIFGYKSIWSVNDTETKRIAVINDCSYSRFFLMWITRDNDYICRPFCKKSTLTESVDTQFITTLDDRQVPYLKSSNFKWELNSNWLTYDEHNAYEALLVSPIVYLYDNETGQRHRVIVTTSEWIERNSQNNKKPFNLTVTVQLDHKENITY